MRSVRAVVRLSAALLAVLALCQAAGATSMTIDLTQAFTETGTNSGSDTWRWGGTGHQFFDLEFSSGNGINLDLDGGYRLGDEWYNGAPAATNHTYDVIRADYLNSNVWQISTIRSGVETVLGSVTEFSGGLTHPANYGYASEESHPTYGPADAGANRATNTDFKSWFWIYRSTLDDSISLNIVSGSGKTGYPNDNGSLRAEIEFLGSYIGTPTYIAPTYIQGNEPGEMKVDPANPARFIPDNATSTGGWTWDEGYDDGGAFGGIKPIGSLSEPPPAVPEPVTMAGLALGIGCLATYVRRRVG